MNCCSILSRVENITTFIQKSELKNIKKEDNIPIPSGVVHYTGNIRRTSFPQQGMCSVVTGIEGEKGKFILKTAKGDYRGRELYAEYLAMKELMDTEVPVPPTYDFFQEGEMYHLLRQYSEGTPLNTLFQNSRDKLQRRPMLIEMGKALSQIHRVHGDSVPYASFIDAQIYFAEQHYKNNTIDPEDFISDGINGEPQDVLRWLKENKPIEGKICVIHGDYRPKNILWKDGKISSIVDWAFCDLGDPYYDLAIFKDYLMDDEEEELFLKAYGIETLDEKRLNYFYKMAPFINI